MRQAMNKSRSRRFGQEDENKKRSPALVGVAVGGDRGWEWEVKRERDQTRRRLAHLGRC